jgi:chromosome segregation ATPase
MFNAKTISAEEKQKQLNNIVGWEKDLEDERNKPAKEQNHKKINMLEAKIEATNEYLDKFSSVSLSVSDAIFENDEELKSLSKEIQRVSNMPPQKPK